MASNNFRVLATDTLAENSHRLIQYDDGYVEIEYLIPVAQRGAGMEDVELWSKQKEVHIGYIRALLKKVMRQFGDDLSFKQFGKANVDRLETYSDKGKKPLSYWGCCLAGEVGEACNLIKKLEDGRTNESSVEAIAKELADIDTYLDLCYNRLGVDRVKVLKEKFNEVSDRYKCPIKL